MPLTKGNTRKPAAAQFAAVLLALLSANLARAQDPVPVLLPVTLTVPVFDPAKTGSCWVLTPFELVPHFHDLVVPADLLAKINGLPPVRSQPEVQMIPTPLPEIGSSSVDTIRVTSSTNPAGGRKTYDLKVGGGPNSEPIISGKGGQLDASTYAGRGQVAGVSVSERIYTGPDYIRLTHDSHLPIFGYRTQSGVELMGVFTQGTRIEDGPLGLRYAVATGGGLSLRIPSDELGPAVGSYHLDFGAAPSLTNASAHGWSRSSAIVPLATGSFGFDW